MSQQQPHSPRCVAQTSPLPSGEEHPAFSPPRYGVYSPTRYVHKSHYIPRKENVVLRKTECGFGGLGKHESSSKAEIRTCFLTLLRCLTYLHKGFAGNLLFCVDDAKIRRDSIYNFGYQTNRIELTTLLLMLRKKGGHSKLLSCSGLNCPKNSKTRGSSADVVFSQLSAAHSPRQQC